ncbi:MAG: ZIP family metal transporter [Pseudomonadota bacterium]
MILTYILLATLFGGLLSVFAAATLSLTVLKDMAHKLVGFSVGVLLAVTFLHMLPEAIEQLDAHQVGATVLAGIFIFFALEKAALWRHDHHEDEGHVCHSHHAAGPLIVIGDGLHNFVDGILIAAAFLQDPALGWATTIAVISHEVPQEVGDFMVLLAAGYSRTKALMLNLLSSLAAVVGGVVGWLTLSGASSIVPYVIALAASSFIYIAVADLVPVLHKQRKPADFVIQFALFGAGTVMVLMLMGHPHH